MLFFYLKSNNFLLYYGELKCLRKFVKKKNSIEDNKLGLSFVKGKKGEN